MLIGFNAPTAGPLSAADDLAKIVVGAEAMGFVKIDLLGNRALSIVHDCVSMLRAQDVVVPDLLAPADVHARSARQVRRAGQQRFARRRDGSRRLTRRNLRCDAGAS